MLSHQVPVDTASLSIGPATAARRAAAPSGPILANREPGSPPDDNTGPLPQLQVVPQLQVQVEKPAGAQLWSGSEKMAASTALIGSQGGGRAACPTPRQASAEARVGRERHAQREVGPEKPAPGSKRPGFGRAKKKQGQGLRVGSLSHPSPEITNRTGGGHPVAAQ